ncbi:MAG: hypothetical protein CVU95_10035 [Firmicutes bacterium HGW-Firmicutes-2]|jgi:hypothetical protein|nr:MAG: hypothetical protein CVU95_10035 [Firmicutes bacterium HGW-Firmicutes-2]
MVMTHYSNEKMNHYSVYGINISTEFDLNELIVSTGKTDLTILKAKVPNFLTGTTQSCAFFQAKENEFLTRIEHVGGFYAIEGNKIICEPDQEAEYMSIKMYLYGFLLPVILMQRGRFPMHGSCIDVDGKSIVISGQSGVGKSSLAIAFRMAGYKLVSDDLIALNDDWHDDIYVHYGFPVQKITVDTAKFLNVDLVGLERIPGEDKSIIPLTTEFQKNVIPLTALFEIVTYDEEEVKIKELFGGEKLRCIIANTYNVEMIGTIGLAQEHFSYGTELAKKIKVFRLSRPIHGFTLEYQMENIIKEIKKIDV